MKLHLSAALCLLFSLMFAGALAQAPSISYPTPQTFYKGKAITPVLPTSSNVGTTGYQDPATVITSMYTPVSVSVDASGNVYTTNQSDTVTVVSPNGQIGYIRAGAPFTDNSFEDAIADDNGNIYVSDVFHKAVIEIEYGTGIVDTVAKGFRYPTFMARDTSGNLYVTDLVAGTLTKVAPGGAITVLASDLSEPGGVAVDNAGYVYVGDIGHNEVKKIPVNGGTEVVVGSGFSHPGNVAIDDDGNIFVVDGGNKAIKEIPVDGSAIQTLATGSQINIAIAVDTDDDIYLVDTYDNLLEESKPIGGYSIKPGLPQGLIISQKTGLISGTPKVTSAAKNYTVTAHNTQGEGTATINIRVLGLSTNALLSSLKLSSGTLAPVFASATLNYTASVPNTITSITVTPTTAVTTSSVKVNDVPVTSGSASAAILLSPGPNVIKVVVTAQDGTTIKTYTVTVTRIASTNANLSFLKLSTGALSPAFAANTISYTSSVPNAITSTTVTPATPATGSTIKVNGVAIASGATSAAIPLAVGANNIAVVVTAQDGKTTKTYVVVVTRAASNNDNLASLKINHGTLTPAFATNTTSYTVSVANTVTSFTVTPTSSVTTSTIKVNTVAVASGTESGPMTLAVGANVINTVVTAQDGTTIKTYKLVVTRAPSNNDNLSGLKINHGTLTPVFATATLNYTASVVNTTTSFTITPTAPVTTSVIKVNGTVVLSGKPSAAITLAVGANTIKTVVTAQDGVTLKTYTIVVTRASSNNDNLSALKLSAGTLTPTFVSTTLSYTASVANSVASVIVTPTSAVTTSAIKVNGTAVVSGKPSAAIPLVVGANSIKVAVLAQDGVTTKTYTVTITRAAGSADAVYQPVMAKEPEHAPAPPDAITVHQGISPNGDGINDFLVIDNITAYPDNKLMIMNRNGQVVFDSKGYDNSTAVFDGHSDKTGAMQLPGTYFYSLDYSDKDGVVRHKTGFIVIKY